MKKFCSIGTVQRVSCAGKGATAKQDSSSYDRKYQPDGCGHV